MFDNALEKLQLTWSNFTEREKRIVAVLGGAVVLFVVGLPLLLMSQANSELEDEIAEFQTLLDDIAMQRERLERATAEKRRSEKRYRQKAPPLGGFLEALAREQGLTIQEVNDQPEKDIGEFRRRNVRVSMPKVSLSPIVHLMSDIETSRYPVAIEWIEIDHHQEGDTYNFKLGVVTFDKKRARPSRPASARSKQNDNEDEEDSEESEEE